MALPKRVVPYNLDPLFEKLMVTLACTSQRFYGRIGSAIDPELLKNEQAKTAMQAAHQINHDVGHGPASPLMVIQRLRRWMGDGKISLEAIKAVAEFFDDAEDVGLPDEESVTVELAPLIQARIRDDAVTAAIESYSKHGDLSKVVELEGKALRVGQVDTSVGTVLGTESFAEVTAMKDIARLSTGVIELDSVLDGGLQSGGLGILVGGSGDGKSMGLSHIGGTALLTTLFVAYATLELPREVVLARVKANVTGVPINTMLAGHVKNAIRRLEELEHRLGRFVVQEFSPKVTTVEDIKQWVTNVEQQAGRKIDVLIVDYGDKLGARAKKGEQQNEYTGALAVFEGLRTYAAERKIFCWTASQASRQKDSKKRLDLNDVADSMHKIRVADLVITLNLRDAETEEPQILFYVAKHRTGRSRCEVGPMPTEYERGRLCPILEPT